MILADSDVLTIALYILVFAMFIALAQRFRLNLLLFLAGLTGMFFALYTYTLTGSVPLTAMLLTLFIFILLLSIREYMEAKA